MHTESMTHALDASKAALLEAGARREPLFTQAIGARMVTAWSLAPAPRDPARHVEAAHAQARRHLARLSAHDPGREVLSVMTEELFVRLTAPRPGPLAAPAEARRYTYTPRKALRRVLDHALDHPTSPPAIASGRLSLRPRATPAIPPSSTRASTAFCARPTR